jgi:hypothetical protein
MSLFFYGVGILGVVLSVVALLVLYCLLEMAKRGEDCLDQLETEMRLPQKTASRFKPKSKCENLGVPTTSDWYNRGII